MFFLKFLTFPSYQKSLIRTIENSYKSIITCLKTGTILLQYIFYQFQYFIITCLHGRNLSTKEFLPTLEVSTNFGSFIPKLYKYNLLFTLPHRAFKLCSNFEGFHQEIDKLKTTFENNGYPKSFVDFCIKKFLDKVFIKKKVILKASKKELICGLHFLEKSQYN